MSGELPPYGHLQDAQMYFWRAYRERYGGLVPMWKFVEERRAHGQMHDMKRRSPKLTFMPPSDMNFVYNSYFEAL